MEHINEEVIDNYILRVYYDESPSDPREDDNLTKMVCFHPRYPLGDDHDFKKDDFNSWAEMEKYITGVEKPIIIKTLYYYDHGGITIGTKPFGCHWDSGVLGFVYIRKEDVRNEFSIKRCGQNMVERCNVLLNGEVDTYDRYVQGLIYGFRVFKVTDGVEEELESCWGFYDEDECMTEAKCIMEWCKNNEQVIV
jgi:hypothetical protein